MLLPGSPVSSRWDRIRFSRFRQSLYRNGKGNRHSMARDTSGDGCRDPAVEIPVSSPLLCSPSYFMGTGMGEKRSAKGRCRSVEYDLRAGCSWRNDFKADYGIRHSTFCRDRVQPWRIRRTFCHGSLAGAGRNAGKNT